MTDEKQRSIGTLSDWELTTTNSPESTSVPASEHDYTIADLYVLLRELRNFLDPARLEYIEGLITKHLNDFNNPHRTDLAKMGSSVLQELYKAWMEEGNTGSREEFLKVLFQYVKIADILTTLEGTAQDQVPSVRGVATYVDRHNTDPDAHEALMGKYFPGEELAYSPSFCIDALMGMPDSASVSREGEMWYVDPTGKLVSAPENVLPTDFTFGQAMFPLFGDLDNKLLVSDDFSDPYWVPVNGSVEVSTSILTPKRSEFAFLFRESMEENPVEHVLTISGDPIPVSEGSVYAVTIMVEPYGRPCFGIRVPESVAGQYAYAHFDLENQEYFINDGADHTCICAKMKKLASGMTRICLFFRSKITTTFLPEFYLLDILSGDTTFAGTGELGAAVFGAQISECSDLPPYIPSLGSPGVLHKTLIHLNLSPWFTFDRGALVLEATNVIPLNLSQGKDLYAVGADSAQISMKGKFPTTHNKRFYFSAYNEYNANFLNQWSDENSDEMITLIHAYSSDLHRFGFSGSEAVDSPVVQTINPLSTFLYLGTDRYGTNPFNGYMKRVVFYPFLCTPGNIQFFLGE